MTNSTTASSFIFQLFVVSIFYMDLTCNNNEMFILY